MGRRKKSAALNQTSAKPVEEPKIEAKVIISEELIKVLKDNHEIDVTKEIEEILSKEKPVTDEDMDLDRYDMTIHSEINPPVEEKPEEVKILEEGAGLVYSEDYVEDPNIERTLADKRGPTDEELIKILPESQKKLSVADKRRKLRHGMKPPTH